MIANLSSATGLFEQLLAVLREGAALVATDRGVGAITALTLCIGFVLGAYLRSVVGRRGKLAAMRKDLDRIAALQESILECVSHPLWTHQDLANLKRETYQKLTGTLGALSSDLSSILRLDAARGDGASDRDSETDPPARKAIEKRLDDFTDLLIPARVAVSQQCLELVMRFQSESERMRQLTGGVASYGFFAELQGLVDDTRRRLFKAARTELPATAPDAGKRRPD